jgi:hypothetical protein
MSSTSTVETNTGRIINADAAPPRLNLLYDDVSGTWQTAKGRAGLAATANYVWDTGTLAWVVMTQPGGAGGGGGLTDAQLRASAVPVSIAASVPVTGPLTDAQLRASAVPTSLATLPALAAGAATIGAVNVNGTIPVSGTFWQATQPVSGTFWQATQPVSIAAAINAAQSGAWSVAVNNFPATQPVSIAAAVAVTGTFFQATQPVSIAATLPVSLASVPTHAVTLQDASGNLATVSTAGAQQVNSPILNTKMEDLMEHMLAELRVISFSLAQLNQPKMDDPEAIRTSLVLLN